MCLLPRTGPPPDCPQERPFSGLRSLFFAALQSAAGPSQIHLCIRSRSPYAATRIMTLMCAYAQSAHAFPPGLIILDWDQRADAALRRLARPTAAVGSCPALP